MANSVAPPNSTTSEDARSLCQAATRMPVAEEHRRAVCGKTACTDRRGGQERNFGRDGDKIPPCWKCGEPVLYSTARPKGSRCGRRLMHHVSRPEGFIPDLSIIAIKSGECYV